MSKKSARAYAHDSRVVPLGYDSYDLYDGSECIGTVTPCADGKPFMALDHRRADDADIPVFDTADAAIRHFIGDPR